MTHGRSPSLDWDLGRSRGRATKRWPVYDEDVIDLTVAEMDLPVAQPVLDAVSDAAQRQSFGYPIPGVRSALPEIATKWLADTLGLSTELEAIHLLPQLMRGISNSPRLYTPEASPAVVPTPTYRSFFGGPQDSRTPGTKSSRPRCCAPEMATSWISSVRHQRRDPRPAAIRRRIHPLRGDR